MTHKTKQAALTAARKALGETAVEGVDFNLRNTGAGWEHESIQVANPAAAKAKALKAAKATVPKKAKSPPKPKATKAKPVVPNGQTKASILIAMMTRPGGATSQELQDAAGWVSHSVRGFIGTLKKNGMPVLSKKIKGEPTYYSIRKGPTSKVDTPPATPEVVGDVV